MRGADEPLIGQGALRFFLSLVVITSILASPALVRAAPNETESPVSGDRYFPQTGYWISDDTIWEYFIRRGGVKTFGYPASRKFLFRGSQVQFFQRRVIQIRPDGGTGQLNILDKGLLEYNIANGATFPNFDEDLVATAPRLGSPNYQTALLDWIKQNVPNVWGGVNVNFHEIFLSTVKFEDAYPNGSGDPNWMPGINLEMWGAATSRLAPDPNNSSFIYIRFQRGIMHYDKSSGQTHGLLLGDHLKSIITGQDLPADLEAQSKASALYRQYDNTKPNGIARPAQLPNSNFKDAFEPEGDFKLSLSTTLDTGAVLDWPQYDRQAVRGLQDIFQEDVSFPQLITYFPWLADGLTVGERRAIMNLRYIAQEDVSLARRILNLPWLSDDLTEDEWEAIVGLRYIAQEDVSLARRILNLPWLSDDLTKDERWATVHLRDIALEDLEFATELVGASLLSDPVSSLQFDALGSLAKMKQGSLEQLAEQAWFKDGLTDEETALIVVLSSVAASEEIFSGLIQDGQVRSETISLPSMGDVNLYAIRRSSVSRYDDVFEVMKAGIEAIEDFMGLPWKKTNVIVLLEPEWRLAGSNTASGLNDFTHVVIKESEGTREFRKVLYHELAHFYWRQETSPQWFHEGSAQLLAYYTLYATEQLDLADRLAEAISQGKEYCKPYGVTNIQEFLDATAGQTTHEIRQANLAFCPYILGESLLLGMYLGLGHEVVAVSLRVLYNTGEAKGEPVTEYEIFRTFLTNTPPEKEAKFREIYQQYHGRPAPDS